MTYAVNIDYCYDPVGPTVFQKVGENKWLGFDPDMTLYYGHFTDDYVLRDDCEVKFFPTFLDAAVFAEYHIG